MLTSDLPNWRVGVVPHADIQEDRISEALFAVNLSRAMLKTGAVEYRDPRLFYERTHLTRTLRSLIADVLKTLYGVLGINRIIHLQSNFGGGKTHTELAIYHLLHSPAEVTALPQIASLMQELGFAEVPAAAIAALPCADLFPGGRKVTADTTIHTLWGEVAYRLGGGTTHLYEIIRKSDEMQIAPGVELLRDLLQAAGPCVLLIDELLHYVDKAAGVPVGQSNLGTQTVAFLRELTEAVDSVPHSILIASLTASRMEDISVLTQEEAELTLAKLEDTMRRLEDARTPVEMSEIYEIVRTRLFQSVDEAAASNTAAVYSELYRDAPWKDLLAQECRSQEYQEVMRRAFPFHPSVVTVLYERWSSRPQFQQTRGTLRFLSHLLAHLWRPESQAAIGPLIHVADIPLADEDVRAESVQVAGPQWESIIGTDIAAAGSGGAATAQRQDSERGGVYSRYRLIQGAATTVFMFTHGGQQSKPTPQAEIRLALAQPGVPYPDLRQALDDCQARLYYFYAEDEGYLFKTEPNPNKVLADERLNVPPTEARKRVANIVASVLGVSTIFNVSYYGFESSPIKETGDVPDDDSLQLVVLPPKWTLSHGRLSGQAGEAIKEIAGQYGKKNRLHRNMVLFLAPDAENSALAGERATDWIAAENVAGTADLMRRFSESQQQTILAKVTNGQNDTKDYVRKAYSMVVLPAPGSDNRLEFTIVELGYIPPSKSILPQVESELRDSSRVLSNFNPDLFAGRWESLWPKTATVITSQALWEKFARRPGSPLLENVRVLQRCIHQGVDRGLFGYGVLRDESADKLDAQSYHNIYLGHYDALDLSIEVAPHTVLLRADQVRALRPPITKEEVAMLLTGARQAVEAVFQTARKSATVQGRVDQETFFAAVLAGVQAGLFGYAASLQAPVLRGADAGLTLDAVHFSGLLISDDTPLPISAQEVARLLPAGGRVAVQSLYDKALDAFGADRVTEGAFLTALRKCIDETQYGYAADDTAPVTVNAATVALNGYIGKVEQPVLPGVRVIHLSGAVSAIDLASIIKTATSLSKLGESKLTVDVRIELQGNVNEHAVSVALTELKSRVGGLKVEDSGAK